LTRRVERTVLTQAMRADCSRWLPAGPASRSN
jgi:hypothetical protein